MHITIVLLNCQPLVIFKLACNVLCVADNLWCVFFHCHFVSIVNCSFSFWMAILTTQNGAILVVGDGKHFSNVDASITHIMVHGARLHMTLGQRQFSFGCNADSVIGSVYYVHCCLPYLW